MDWNRIEGNWKQTTGKIKEKWGQLTDDDLTQVNGKRAIDGEWRYSAEGPLRENWDLVWVDDTVPADVTAQFADESAFIPRPA